MPETPTRDQLMRQVSQCIAAHGEEYFQTQMLGFHERLRAVNDAQTRFGDVQEHGDPATENEQLVEDIATATREYYNFIAGLHDDVRGVLLTILEMEGGPGTTLGQLGNTFGLDIKDIEITTSPLFKVQSIRPKSYIMQVDAITNHLATLGDQTQIRVGKRGSQPILTTVALDMPDHMRIEGGGALSTYDKSILNGVTSLLESGNSVFSLPMLYHAMTGKQNPTVDEQLAEELTAKLEQMRRMMLTIDLTEENEAHYLTNADGEELKIEDLKLEGYLMPLNKISGVVNGKKTELYQIIQQPPLYTYSKMKRQLASVRISLLDAPINNNATTIPLKTYLLQRIELMKNKKNSIVSNTILYDTVYQELGAQDANKTRKMRIRTYATTILQHFVDQGYIKSYTEYKAGRAIAGVNIVL